MVIEDKSLLLKMHPCSEGLSHEEVREISEKCDLLRCNSGHILHRANEPIDSVYLVIHGSLKQTMVDIQGNVLLERFQIAGTQVGAMAAALGEPSPLQIEVTEPTTLLRLNYQDIFEITKHNDRFRRTFSAMIAEAVKSTLMGEKRKKEFKFISIVHQTPDTRLLSRRLLERLHQLDQRPYVFSDQADWPEIEGVPHCCLLNNGSYFTEREIRERVGALPDRGPIFFDFSPAVGKDRAAKLFESSEKVFWVVTQDNYNDAARQLGEIELLTPSWRDKVSIVWLLPADRSWAPRAPGLLALAGQDFKLTFAEPPKHRSRIMLNGIERLVHEIRGIRIGLALGGGAARGMAHLGVMRVLEENGIFVDMIAGTSAGAMTGVLYASGMEPEYNVNCFLRDLALPWLFRKLPNGGYWYLLHKYRTGQFDPMLRNYLQDSRLEQLPIPVNTITVDLVSGQPVVRSDGDSVHAILESINLPVLAQPINRDGRALVDGGIINNVPANVLVSKGCNFVIAVSVTAQMAAEFASNRPDTPTSQMKPASVLQTIMRTFTVQNVNLNSAGVQPADFVIEPNVSEFDITEFTRADEMAGVGAKTALGAVPEIKRLLSRIDNQLFKN